MKILHKRSLWFILGLLLLMIGIPVLRFVRDVQQQERDRALIAAIKKHDTTAVRALLEEGADANARESEEPSRSLWQRVKELFSGKSQSRPSGSPALSLTETRASFDEKSASILLSKGADVNAADKEGRSPIVTGIDRVSNQIEYGGDELPPPYPICKSYIRLLIHAGADVNAVNYLGQTRLNRVALIGDADLARLLLEKGAKVNQGDNQGITPLMTATQYGNADTVKVLLEAHAEVSMQNQEGHAALFIAKEELNIGLQPKAVSLRIIRLLRQAGAQK